jgi:hypothetical protein
VKDSYLVAAFVGLNLADCALTLRILGDGGQELNPLMAALIGASPFAFVSLKVVLALVATLVISKYRPRLFKAMTYAMTLPVVWNLVQLLRTA